MRFSNAASRRRSLVVALLVVGCRADSAGPDGGSALNVAINGEPDRPLASCQVVRNAGQDGAQQSYRYDGRGLVSAWADGLGTLLPQYDASGRLIRARYVSGDVTLATIVYRYEGGKIARETWLTGTSETIADILVNTWNRKGQLVRRESLPFGVYAAFKYDAAGNAYQVDVLGTDGSLFLSNTYAFTARVKSPDQTLRGLPYGPQFINYVFNPWRQTAAKAVVSDAEGHLVTLFDQDPARSVLVTGQQNLPVYQNLFDKLSGTFFAQTWGYQNCPGNNFPPDVPPAAPSLTRQAHGASIDVALRGSLQNVRQQIDALRRKYSR
jgi:hypothetical protein